MSIEISFQVELTASIAFDVESASEVTHEMLEAKIDSIRAEMDRCGFMSSDASLYCDIHRVDKQVPVEAYNRETGEYEPLPQINGA